MRRPTGVGHSARAIALAAVSASVLVLAVPASGIAQERDDDEEKREQQRERLERLRRTPPPIRIEPDSPGQRPRPSDTVRVPRRRAGAAPSDTMARERAAQPDSIRDALRALDGYEVTEYSGSTAAYAADSGKVVLTGAAELVRGGRSMTADSLLTYDQRSGVICGYGSPVLSGERTPVRSDQVCYDVERQVGAALGARTEFQEGATWYVHGDRVFTVGSERLYSDDARFTTCDLEVPHYHFNAGRFKIVADQVLVARNVTLNFAGVPVLWLPFMAQSLKEGRRSGFLTPRFGINDVVRTNSGYNRSISNVGFYWAVNDYMGAEIAGEWISDRWKALRGTFEYRWLRQFLNGRVSVQQYWQDSGSRQLTLNTNNNWEPGERTNVRLSGRYASSSDFVERNSFDPQEVTRTLTSTAGVTHRFAWGGSLNLSGKREQFVTEEKVNLTLPSASLSLPSVTLFNAPASSASWYNNLTWSGSTQFGHRRTDLDEAAEPNPSQRDRRTLSGSLSSNFRLGQLVWRQSLDAEDRLDYSKPPIDSVDFGGVPRTRIRSANWSTNLEYPINLIGSTTLRPRLGLTGDIIESPDTEGEPIVGPVTLDFGASVNASMYGFYGGVGPFSRFRHKLAPSISYTYKPEPAVSEEQRAVFGTSVAEQNNISIGLTQTFEAKPQPDASTDDTAADTATAESPDGAQGGAAADDELQRRDTAEPIELLSINTSAVTYDFVRAREAGVAEAVTTGSISNSITSDFLRGLNIRFSHNLFRDEERVVVDESTCVDCTEPWMPLAEARANGLPTADSVETVRVFDPHLEAVNASYTITGDSWLFRVLGLDGGDDEAGAAPDTTARDSVGDDATLEGRPPTPGRNLVPGDRSAAPTAGGRARGPWRASLSYSLTRPRELAGGTARERNEMLRMNLSFRPTQNWSVAWNTGYRLAEGEFTNNSLTLTRDLHRWRAHFDLSKSPNGNFFFQFRVELRDNPDLKLDYEQRSDPIQTDG